MRYSELLNESPMPDTTQKRRVYYHGTQHENRAYKIMNDGIKVHEYEQKRGANLIPVSGKNYITTDLATAMIYALGGAFAGSNPPPSIRENDTLRYGYIFKIKGNQLGDIQPDEDSIGNIISAILDDWNDENGLEVSIRYVKGKKEKEFYKNVYNDRNLRSELSSLIDRHLTKNQKAKIREGEFRYYAMAGKKLVSHMSEDMQRKLITYGSNVANDKVLYPHEVWRLDKRLSPKLKPDGSNLFKLAERIK